MAVDYSGGVVLLSIFHPPSTNTSPGHTSVFSLTYPSDLSISPPPSASPLPSYQRSASAFCPHLPPPTFIRYGDLYNAGLRLFSQGSNGDNGARWGGIILPPDGTTSGNNGVHGTIGSRRSALRDPLFFQWVARVMDIVRRFEDTIVEQLENDAAPITVDGVTVRDHGDGNPGMDRVPGRPDPPPGFDDWVASKTNWKKPQEEFCSDYMRTTTTSGKAEVHGPWSRGQLEHRPFALHMRISRGEAPDMMGAGGGVGRGAKHKRTHFEKYPALDMVSRVFLAPASHAQERKYWVEVDRFRFKMIPGRDHQVLSRPHFHSSVTRRKWAVGAAMSDAAALSRNSAVMCGWPAHMVLPAGGPSGTPEARFKLMVMVTEDKAGKGRMGTVQHSVEPCPSYGGCNYYGTMPTDVDLFYPDTKSPGFPMASQLRVGRSGPLDPLVAARMLPSTHVSELQIIHRDTTRGEAPHRFDLVLERRLVASESRLTTALASKEIFMDRALVRWCVKWIDIRLIESNRN